ncbi:hypothetical protein D2N39_03980 [Gemmobacter lutimaris]|uniref:Uncharacterized protein n=1 Tax=Gemmobacter lutimaris TaxID=2306023 RepID=A0A398BR09_9RHOB|nr:hypothetical protein [Gemmobacter lutimaris]RID92842.1 hypothetical protein D2N39_03980 [Gemmobacter lutimaris]
MTSDLLRFWNDAPLEHPAFIHPRDDIPAKLIQPGISSYPDFLAAFENDQLSPTAFHLNLLPQPYQGDLDNAEILLLFTNPGLSACDYHTEDNYPDFREDLIATIRQERRDHLFLNPKWAWTSGFVWWESKLRDVARLIATERFDGHYGRALADLSRRIAAIELVPYHSFKFSGFKETASADAARRFVANVDPSRTVIVTRSVPDWRLPDATHIIKYPTTHARSASLGVNSIGGKAILSRYGIVAT